MRTKLGFLSVILLIGLLASCATGEYKPMKASEGAEVVGTIHTTFYVTGAFRYRSTINRQAYISLMAEAQKQYPDIIVDIQDISWAIGQGDAANNNYEYSAIGRVIKLPQNN